jgi:predicted dehydrogenase
VVGEAGNLWSDGLSLFYKPHAGDQVVVQESEGEPDTFALEIADFISCLREGRRPLNNEVDGVNVLKVILAAYASADRRMIVEIKDL